MIEEKNEIQVIQNDLEILFSNEQMSLLDKRQKYNKILNMNPSKDKLKNHPFISGVKYLPISHIQGLMDAFFFCQWGMRNFETKLISNEIIGIMEVYYIDPITGKEFTRTGSASIQIMVDSVPEDVKKNKQQKNQWALNPSNKKSNALETGFPKLDAMCFKNACSKIGNIFGRNINRKFDEIHDSSNSNLFENSDKLSKILNK